MLHEKGNIGDFLTHALPRNVSSWAISISSISSLRLIGVELQFDTLKPTIFIAFKLIAFINTQLFIARKRIRFRSSRSTLIREQI